LAVTATSKSASTSGTLCKVRLKADEKKLLKISAWGKKGKKLNQFNWSGVQESKEGLLWEPGSVNMGKKAE